MTEELAGTPDDFARLFAEAKAATPPTDETEDPAPERELDESSDSDVEPALADTTPPSLKGLRREAGIRAASPPT